MTDAELIEQIHLAATVALSSPDVSEWDRGYRWFAAEILKLLEGQPLDQFKVGRPPCE